jgi:hypothetical protein
MYYLSSIPEEYNSMHTHTHTYIHVHTHRDMWSHKQTDKEICVMNAYLIACWLIENAVKTV